MLKTIFLLISFLFFTSNHPLLAETVYLKSGVKIEGEIIEVTENAIKIKLPSGGITILQKDMVDTEKMKEDAAAKVTANDVGLQKEIEELLKKEDYAAAIEKYKKAISALSAIKKVNIEEIDRELSGKAQNLIKKYEEQSEIIKAKKQEYETKMEAERKEYEAKKHEAEIIANAKEIIANAEELENEIERLSEKQIYGIAIEKYKKAIVALTSVAKINTERIDKKLLNKAQNLIKNMKKRVKS